MDGRQGKDILKRSTSETQTIQLRQLSGFIVLRLENLSKEGRLLEKLRAQVSRIQISLTFFSLLVMKSEKIIKGVDWVFYLPMDSASNAKRFFKYVKPQLVIFVKYEYWYYYLSECKKRNIPLLMISAVFRKDQPFFKWYGGFTGKC